MIEQEFELESVCLQECPPGLQEAMKTQILLAGARGQGLSPTVGAEAFLPHQTGVHP